MAVSIGKGVTTYKSVEAEKGVGSRNVSVLANVSGGGGGGASPSVQLFRTQYVVASAVASVQVKMPIPIPITTNSRTIMFSMNSKYLLSGPQDASARWVGTRDSDCMTEFVSNSSVAFTRSTSLAVSSSMAGLGFIEYLGATGGAHDIQSLIRFVATLTTGQSTLSTTLPITPSDPNKVVPFLTSMMCQGAATTPKTVYAYMSGLDELNVGYREINSTTAARHAYVNAVEFVGNAWTVRHCYLATSNNVSANVNIMTSPFGLGVTAAVNWGQTIVIPMHAIQGSSKGITATLRPHSIYPIIVPVDSSSAAVIYSVEKETAFCTAAETFGYLISNAEMSVLRIDNTCLDAGWKYIDMSANSPGSASACWAIMQAVTSSSAYPHGCFTTLQISDTTVAFHNSTLPQENSRQHLQIAKLPTG